MPIRGGSDWQDERNCGVHEIIRGENGRLMLGLRDETIRLRFATFAIALRFVSEYNVLIRVDTDFWSRDYG